LCAFKHRLQGVDWVKMDWCGGAVDVHGSYAAMGKALNESGRHIALNMCRGDTRPWSWINPFAQSWRVTEDHSGTWSQPSHGIKQGIATAMTIPRSAYNGFFIILGPFLAHFSPSTPPRTRRVT